MKKWIALLCTLTLALSLTACGGKPSDSDIKKALDEGTITFEDAMDKGWIDQAWIDANYEPIEGKSRIHLFEPFETTYLDGTPVSSSIISDEMCLVFFDTTEDDALEKLKVFEKLMPAMEQKGVPVMGIITDEDPAAARENLAEFTFPILVYNEAMKQSLADYNEMIEEHKVTFVLTKAGGFYSAWQTDVNEDVILTEVDGIVSERE